MDIWREHQLVMVRFPYDAEINTQLRRISGGKWNPNRKLWEFPLEKYNTLVALKAKWEQMGAKKEHVVYKHFSKKTDFEKSSNNWRNNNENYNKNKRSKYIPPSKQGYSENVKHSASMPESTEKMPKLNAYKTHSVDSKDGILTHMRQYMTQGGYSQETIKSYLNHVRRFLAFSNNRCDVYWVNTYMVEILESKHCSHAYCNQAINAIKLFFKQQGIDDRGINSLIRPKKEFKLPKVMSKSEVKALFEHTDSIKHKTALMFAYSCGMRVSEVANLCVADIDRERMMIIIKQSKGRKDRMIPLSKKLLEQYDAYEERFRPFKWVFENQMRDGPISARTLQNVFNQSKKKAGVRDHATFHSLRHSYATHLLDSGIDIRLIQELLGHASSKTTEIYTHVTTQTLGKIVNPLDEL